MLAHEHINRGVFPFFMIWSLYPAISGQAIPSAFGLFWVAKTVELILDGIVLQICDTLNK